jgi:hypothetical protein
MLSDKPAYLNKSGYLIQVYITLSKSYSLKLTYYGTFLIFREQQICKLIHQRFARQLAAYSMNFKIR